MIQKDTFKKDLLASYDTRSTFLSPDLMAWYEWFEFYTERVYKEILKPIEKDAPILDLGCSRGGLLRSLSLMGYQNLTGIDLSGGDLAIARNANPSITFIQDDIFTFLKSNQNMYKVIFLKAVIEHIDKDKIQDLLQLMHEALRQDGLVIIDVYNAAYIFSQHDRYMDFTHEVGFTKESLLQVMEMIFSKPIVTSIPSPLKLGLKDRVRYKFARTVFTTLVHWMEPETRSLSFLDRLLIGVGSKK